MENQALADNISFQFSIAKQLLEYHLSSLEQAEYMWHSPNSQLYLKEIDGEWYAELPETEAYEIGPPSMAWTLWHITYWWEMVLDYSFGNGNLTKDEIKVTSDVEEIKAHINSLVNQWEEKLSSLSADQYQSKAFSEFPFNNEVEFHKLASWLNLELIKNAAEIGYARFAYATSDHK